MNRLEEILRAKRLEVEALRPRARDLHEQALARTDFRSFHSALKRPDEKLAVIAEVKKASPSAGLIAPSFDPVASANNYQQNGSDAISVLTDEPFFQGKLGYLSTIRACVHLPLLRKDFILDEIQIAEAAAAGADAILLIVAALAQKQLVELRQAAGRYQLDALIEVHSPEELERALDAGANLIGINNRNLATFEVDLSVTEKLSQTVPDEVVLTSESGIRTAADARRMRACGVDAVLVGEALMRGDISIAELREDT